MARTVNEAAYTARRKAILDAARRAVMTKGYEQMAISDLLSELRISSGAFYHYFDSKPALLLAMIDHMVDQIEERVLPIIHDPTLGALEKLQRFFDTLSNWKMSNKHLLMRFLPIWYSDENAIVRQKLYIARVKRCGPWLEEIIRQGAQEGVLTTPYPDQAARMVLALTEDLGLATADIFLAKEHSPDDLPRLELVIAGTVDAIERVLGAPPGCFPQDWHNELVELLDLCSRQQEEQQVHS